MKAVYFLKTGGVENICVGDLDLPTSEIASGELELQFLSGSLNHLDLWVLKGLPRVKYEFPHIVGADCSAIVLKTKSKKFKEGDRVLVYPASSLRPEGAPENLSSDFKIRGENTAGVFREKLVIEDRYALPCPQHLSNEQAASIPLVYLTAWQMIREKAALFPGDFDREKICPVLIYGAGSGVTQSLLEILISFGVKDIALCSRDATKLDAWRARGVKTFEVSDDLESELRKEYPDRFSFVFDHIGERFIPMSLRLLKNGGKLISCGATSGAMASVDWRHLYFRQLQILGSTMGSLDHFYEVVSWINQAKIQPTIKHVYPLDQAQEAFQLMEDSKQDGKIVLTENLR